MSDDSSYEESPTDSDSDEVEKYANTQTKKVIKQFVSDMKVDEHNIAWTITRFTTLMKQDEWINEQTCEFEAGSIIPPPTPEKVSTTSSKKIPVKWTMELYADQKDEVKANRDFIGVSLYLTKDQNAAVYQSIDIIVEGDFTIEFKGAVYCDFCEEEFVGYLSCPNCERKVKKPVPLKGVIGPHALDSFKDGWTVHGMIKRTEAKSYCCTVEDKENELTIDCNMKLMTLPSGPASLLPEISFNDFQAASVVKAQEDFKKLLENEIPCKDVTILTSDRQEFIVQWGLLAARSSFFEIMYNSKMKEVQEGVIHLPDISGKGFEILRHFIYTGMLQETWKEEEGEVVAELINAAAKYMLKDLLEYLEGALGTICNSKTAILFLLLAQKFSLKKAEKDILQYIQEHEMHKGEDFLKLCESFANTILMDKNANTIATEAENEETEKDTKSFKEFQEVKKLQLRGKGKSYSRKGNKFIETKGKGSKIPVFVRPFTG